MKKNKMSFEDSMKKLEEIVLRLESGDETLEDTIVLYEEGINLGNNCEKMLNDAEQKITIIDINE